MSFGLRGLTDRLQTKDGLVPSLGHYRYLRSLSLSSFTVTDFRGGVVEVFALFWMLRGVG
jgi:hypothetical protein